MSSQPQPQNNETIFPKFCRIRPRSQQNAVQTNVKKFNGRDHQRGHNPPCRIVHFQVQAVQDINKSYKLIQVPKFESNHIGM